MAEAIQAFFDGPNLSETDCQLGLLRERYRDSAPRLVEWVDGSPTEGLAVMALPSGHQERWRTTNGQERLNKETNRQTRVATLFPNEAFVLHLATDLVTEIPEDWDTGRTYINTEGD